MEDRSTAREGNQEEEETEEEEELMCDVSDGEEDEREESPHPPSPILPRSSPFAPKRADQAVGEGGVVNGNLKSTRGKGSSLKIGFKSAPAYRNGPPTKKKKRTPTGIPAMSYSIGLAGDACVAPLRARHERNGASASPTPELHQPIALVKGNSPTKDQKEERSGQQQPQAKEALPSLEADSDSEGESVICAVADEAEEDLSTSEITTEDYTGELTDVADEVRPVPPPLGPSRPLFFSYCFYFPTE